MHPKVDTDHLQTLPTWIRSIEDSAFKVQRNVLGERINRVNANPLVGLPFGQRSYNAAGNTKINLAKLKCLKFQDHLSMFVKGFVIHEIGTVESYAEAGNLSKQWLISGDWHDLEQDPPEDLWRTLVANRGPDGRNPSGFYPRALKESLSRGLKGDIVDAQSLIHHSRCSTIAQFQRRMQEVIFNRDLFPLRLN